MDELMLNLKASIWQQAYVSLICQGVIAKEACLRATEAVRAFSEAIKGE